MDKPYYAAVKTQRTGPQKEQLLMYGPAGKLKIHFKREYNLFSLSLMVFLVNLPLLLESAIFCWQRKALKFEPKLGEGEQWLSSRSCDACPVAPVFEMLKQVWLFSSLGIVNACLQREHIAKVWTIFQWDQSSLNLHDAKRLGRRVESSVNRPAVLSLCIPPPQPPSVWLFRDRFQIVWLVPRRRHQSWQLSLMTNFLSISSTLFTGAATAWSSLSSHFDSGCLKKTNQRLYDEL